jgi:hypothetical protein
MVRAAVDARRDHYAVLGVEPDADPAEIAAAFRRLAKRHHPDAPGGDAARFAEVRDAWEVLASPTRRLEYDLERAAHARAAAQRHRLAVPVTQRTTGRPPTRRGALALVWAGVACTAAGVAVAVLTFALASDTARFRAGSVPVDAVRVGGPGDRQIEFTTLDGETVRVAEPKAANPGVRGDTIAVRYDRDDPARVRVDESTVARDVTIGIVGAKLLAGGPVLAIAGARRLRRLHPTVSASLIAQQARDK